MTAQKEHSAIEAFKVWIFPSLVSLLGVMIWNDVNDVKADVKQFMIQSSIDKTRIDNLERVVYGKALNMQAPSMPPADTPAFVKVEAIVPNSRIAPRASAKKTK